MEILGECSRFRAEHYRIERIEKFIDCRGNALPLRKMANSYDLKADCQKFSDKDGSDGEEAGDR